jgi:Leucine-rich repeat (LRR) protein
MIRIITVALIAILFKLQAQDDIYYMYLNPEASFKVYDNLPEALEHPNRVRAIKLENMQLKQVPKDIEILVNLECLDLSKNEIQMLPDDVAVIGGLKNLKCLVLSSNKINKFSVGFAEALPKALEILVLRDNEINTLPIEISKLDRIHFLDLSGNRFDSFPESILQMDGLISLWITETKIKSLKGDFRNMKKLKNLTLSDNFISDVVLLLPESIETVVFARNNLGRIDANFEECVNLDLLNLHKNPNLLMTQELDILLKGGILEL